MNLRAFLSLCFFSILSISLPAQANDGFLPADQAFKFSVESISNQKAQLQWSIAPHYYLYHNQFKVMVNDRRIQLNLPAGHEKNDPTFGVTDVHYDQVMADMNVRPNTRYQVNWQGCAEDGLCYPMQHMIIQTDADGLFPQNSATASKTLFAAGRTNSATDLNTNTAEPSSEKLLTDSDQQNKTNIANGQDNNAHNKILNQTATSLQTSAVTASTQAQVVQDSSLNEHATSLQWNDDQSFFNLLSRDSFLLNLLVFFGLGILLAFLPCSLPLIPILSGIIVQRATGYKVVAIALSFIVSMAAVYSLMGIAVAEIGYSFQRWFQSPVVISIFAIAFVALALNLFGVYQLSLPQRLVQKLGSLQDRQKGGTITGAAVMGALSALIVGPCMSAPLAGALLFVSQTHSAVLGGLYLFILGLGIGLPLFIVSVFGSGLLPKPGVWMDRLKVSFGFVMLMMAVYFIRPMLPSVIYAATLALLCVALAIYLFRALKDIQKTIHKALLALIAVLCIAAAAWNIKQSIEAYQVEHTVSERLNWNKVTTAEQLDQTLQQARQTGQPIIIDVYADWCVACQPIEKEVMPRADVQQALHGFSLIKLDLTTYDASQDSILKTHEILGPPTMLFLNANAREIRPLRLTGTFTAQRLLQQLQKAAR
ncbi:protein-disulfide reductase DsbD [Acinetobacter sp. WZC-1]|uniref:protein-disulfide reductase DsbD n=1 Tax=Acinetobacter sp. WZC-1 TaxID=3459034 RepID=UPI00403DBF52